MVSIPGLSLLPIGLVPYVSGIHSMHRNELPASRAGGGGAELKSDHIPNMGLVFLSCRHDLLIHLLIPFLCGGYWGIEPHIRNVSQNLYFKFV